MVVSDKMKYMDGQSWCKKLVIIAVADGIVESTGENRTDTEKMRKVLHEKLQLHQDAEMLRAHHRVKPGNGRPMPIVVILPPVLVEFAIPRH